MFKGTNAPGAGHMLADRIRKASEHRAFAGEAAPAKRPRRALRNPTFRNATLALPSGNVPVVVTNVSDTGARIEFVAKVALKGKAVLVAPLLNIKKNVVVTWQREGCAGLEFADA